MPLKFYLDNRPNKAGEHPIRLSVCIRQTRYITSIGIAVNPQVWIEAGEVKSRYCNSKGIKSPLINLRLSKIKSQINEYELKQKTRPTKDEIKEVVREAILFSNDITEEDLKNEAIASKTSIFDYLDEFVEEQSTMNQWAYATLQVWKTFRHHLYSFSRTVTFEDFDEKGLNRFILHLRKNRGLEEKTVQKHYSNLKWFMNWAIRKGYTNESYILKYRPKFKVLEKPVIFLTKEELLKLYHLEIPANGTVVVLKDMYGNEYEKKVQEAGALSKTRDLFCFCAFTSLRYSDMANLKRIDIKDDCLYITTQKTNDRLPINLNSFAKAILDKYEDCDFPKGLALPVISNQKMNHYLKDLCELCGFNEPITITCYRAGTRVEETYPKWALIGTHAGRRTFICFALSSGIPPQIVMKWTGHSDYKAMKPYIDIAETTKAKAMSLFEMELSKD